METAPPSSQFRCSPRKRCGNSLPLCLDICRTDFADPPVPIGGIGLVPFDPMHQRMHEIVRMIAFPDLA